MGNYIVNESSTAFRFDGQTVTELPHLLPEDPITLVTAINNSGVICGYSHNSVGNSQAVYYVGSTIHALPDPNGANPDADLRAYDINDNNVIVGYFWNTAGERTAFYYQDGVSYSLDSVIRANGLTDLQTASAVNNNNVICGSASDSMGVQTPWTYDLETQTFTVIGRLGLSGTSARDINDLGQVIGRARNFPWDPYQAVVYDGSWTAIDPDVTETLWGIQVSTNGRMIGHANTSEDRWGWYADSTGAGSIIEIVLPGWSELTLNAINELDWMAGLATDGSSLYYGLLIQPPWGDYDHDGYLRAADAEALGTCMTGPSDGVVATDNCLRAFDSEVPDGDIDMHDFQAFAIQFEGDQ